MRERSARRRTLKAGSIELGNGGAIDCTIRNISATGACLTLASPIGVPDRFELVFRSDQSRRQCRVVWRSATQIGLAFEDAAPDSEADSFARLRVPPLLQPDVVRAPVLCSLS